MPFFKEAYRFVFTKFSLVYVFGFSMMLGLGVEWVTRKMKRQVLIGRLLYLVFGLSLVYYAWPAFKGEFFIRT